MTRPSRRRGRRFALFLLLFVLGLIAGRILSDDGGPASVDEVQGVEQAPMPAPSPAPPVADAAPVSPPTEAAVPEDLEEPPLPVRLALTSYTHRTGTAEGSVLRACGVTDLPEGARLGYEIVPVAEGDNGWVRERQPPHLYEGTISLGAVEDERGLRDFCFEADVYASCGLEPFHPLNCPLHVTVWFASTITGFAFTQVQPENVLERFGMLGERIAASEDCDIAQDCARIRPTNPPRIEYSERIFDSCPPYRSGCLPR